MKTLRHLLISVLVMLSGSTIFHSCRKDEPVQKMKVETTALTNITTISARVYGRIIDLGEGVEQHGHCWSKYGNPTISGDKTENGSVSETGVYSIEITELEAGTVYHVRAYMQSASEVVYGKDITFTTLDGKVSLTTSQVTNITFNSARSGGNIVSVNGDEVILRGICWDTLATVNLKANTGFTTNGSGIGSFPSELTGLLQARTYYVKAYAMTSLSIGYGNARSFVTMIGKGTMTTTPPSNITSTTATTGGNITHDGGSTIIEHGICYGTVINPTIADNKTIDGAGTGTFTSSLSGLSPNTNYYVRAYATNAITTIYGEQQSFWSKGLPEITTDMVSEHTESSAICGGNVTNDWGYLVTERGICWSTSQNPTTDDSKTSDGSGTGSFTSSISVPASVIYYVRAYATNGVGTSYGEQRTFILTSIVEITNPITGKIWMDRNLGAKRVATSLNDSEAFGDLYQWGRGSDGHEKLGSGSTSILSSSDTPEHGFFIATVENGDWRSPQNDKLWQGVNGTNNPCPKGFRVPTQAEWEAEYNMWSPKNQNGAFLMLKLTVTNQRFENGIIRPASGGYYWSSTVNGKGVRGLHIYQIDAIIFNSTTRTRGFSVRCIKD